jgi:hypothetical protein
VGPNEEHRRDKQPPYLDPGRVIDTRLREVERQQAEEKEYQRGYNLRQLRFNKWLVIFTGFLFVTSVASDLLLWRYVVLTKQSADAATSASGTAASTLGEMKSNGESTKQQIDRLIAEQQRTTRHGAESWTEQRSHE